MARRHTSSQITKSAVRTAVIWLVGAGLLILFAKLDTPEAQLLHVLGCAAKGILGLLPTAWHALQVYAFDHQPSSDCPIQTLASLWPILRMVAGAA
jgi:hypothetical protein